MKKLFTFLAILMFGFATLTQAAPPLISRAQTRPKINLDLSFFQQLREQFQSPGEAAEAM